MREVLSLQVKILPGFEVIFLPECLEKEVNFMWILSVYGMKHFPVLNTAFYFF